VYPYEFAGPDSPRGRELVTDIEGADLVVEDRKRLRLDRALEFRIQAILQRSFVPLLDYKNFRFYARRTPPDASSAPPGAAGSTPF
jgi:hypothetical protein